MEEFKGTKGEWIVTGCGTIECDNMIIADVYFPDMDENAQLISAAPELLQALQGAVEFMQSWCQTESEIRKLKAAKAAINKALGH